MKAYKAFNRDLTCLGYHYKEGETYEMDGEISLCRSGFHFCKDLVLTLQYYSVQQCITENKYAEVEILGDVIFDEPNRHKGVTNKIKIVRVLSDQEVLGMVDNNANSGDRNSGHRNSGNNNSGHDNSGHGNSGDNNSGHGNSGDNNSGDNNSGHDNRGDNNSGDNNSGHRNSGNNNSGHRNSGHGNSGDNNSGNWNSGNWNSCNKEAGFFNSVTPEKINVFNKPCDIKKWNFAYKPAFLYFDIDHHIGYKKSFIKSWESADKNDREKVKELPNFDADVFYEISGIDLRSEK